MPDSQKTPFRLRMAEAKKEAIERYLSVARAKLALPPEPTLIPKVVHTATANKEDLDSALVPKPIHTAIEIKQEAEPALTTKPVDSTIGIKHELEPAVSLSEVPQIGDVIPSEIHTNRYAGLKGGKKRKRSEATATSIEVKEELFVAQQENDEADSVPSATSITKKYTQPSRRSPSGSNTAKSSKVKQERPFAPPKKPAVKKAGDHAM